MANRLRNLTLPIQKYIKNTPLEKNDYFCKLVLSKILSADLAMKP